MLSSRQLVEYVILDIEQTDPSATGRISMAEAQVG